MASIVAFVFGLVIGLSILSYLVYLTFYKMFAEIVNLRDELFIESRKLKLDIAIVKQNAQNSHVKSCSHSS